MDWPDFGRGPHFLTFDPYGDLLIRLICIKHIKHNSSHLNKHFEGSFVKIG